MYSSVKFLAIIILNFSYFAHGRNLNCSNNKQPNIIIVGAGLAGLTAATHLIENGFNNILILEAENRYGGRVHSIEFDDDGYIDLGAQWVHGQNLNKIYEMLNGRYKFGLSGFDTKLNTFIRSDGSLPDQQICEDLFDLSSKIVFSSCNEMINYNKSLGAFYREKFLNFIAYEKNKTDIFLANEMIDYFEKEMNIWNGSASWQELSAKLHCLYGGFSEGPLYQTFNRDGFKTFFKYLTNQDDPKKFIDVFSKILYKKTVVNIQWNQKYALDSRKVIVTCSDGHKYFADHLIFTPSLGVLKEKYRSLFSPQLSKSMIKAIKAMGYGSIGKIFLKFNNTFWPINEDFVGYGFLWTEKDKNEIRGTRREWLLDLQAFTIVDSFPNVLEALLGGKHQAMFEQLSDRQLIDDCMWMLEKFLTKNLPRPSLMKRTKWLTQKNFRGTYSYFSMDALKNNITPSDLGQTFYNLKGKPEILFAGEATDLHFSSNAHGAVSSGYRVANELISYHNKC